MFGSWSVTLFFWGEGPIYSQIIDGEPKYPRSAQAVRNTHGTHYYQYRFLGHATYGGVSAIYAVYVVG